MAWTMTSLEGISPLFIKKSERIGGECEKDDVLSIVSLLFIHINKKAVEKYDPLMILVS